MGRHDTYVQPSARGVYLPRWMVAGALGALMLWFGWGMMREPEWVVQRLEAPDGAHSALLKRVMYVSQYLQVELLEGFGSDRVYRSGELPTDYKVDLRERLLWSQDSKRLYLSVQGRLVWGLELPSRRPLGPAELTAAQSIEAERIAR
jgi:hypothetical protein